MSLNLKALEQVENQLLELSESIRNVHNSIRGEQLLSTNLKGNSERVREPKIIVVAQRGTELIESIKRFVGALEEVEEKPDIVKGVKEKIEDTSSKDRDLFGSVVDESESLRNKKLEEMAAGSPSSSFEEAYGEDCKNMAKDAILKFLTELKEVYATKSKSKLEVEAKLIEYLQARAQSYQHADSKAEVEFMNYLKTDA